jgi:hypothetical protein
MTMRNAFVVLLGYTAVVLTFVVFKLTSEPVPSETVINCPTVQERAVLDTLRGRWLVYAGPEEDQCHLNDLVHQERVWLKHHVNHHHHLVYG